MRYFASGWNQPGYMPETEAQHHDDFGDALDELKTALDDEQEQMFIDGLPAEQHEIADALNEILNWRENDNTGGYWQVYANDYVYWIHEIEESDYEPDDEN